MAAHHTNSGSGPYRIFPHESGRYPLEWSPDGKWIAYGSETTKKARPEGTIWSVDIASLLENAVKEAANGSSQPGE